MAAEGGEQGRQGKERGKDRCGSKSQCGSLVQP